MPLDPRTKSEKTIDRDLAKVFDGKFFRRSLKITGTTTADFLFITDGKIVKFETLIKSNKGLDVVGYEGCSVSSNGTTLTALNMHRGKQSTETTTCLLFASPTVITTGSEFYNDHIPATDHPLTAGGTLIENTAFVLEKNEKYLYRITAVTTATFWVAGEYTEE